MSTRDPLPQLLFVAWVLQLVGQCVVIEAHVDGDISNLIGWRVKRKWEQEKRKRIWKGKSILLARKEEIKQYVAVSVLRSVVFPLSAQPTVPVGIFIQANSVKHIFRRVSHFTSLLPPCHRLGSDAHHHSPGLCQSLLPALHASSLIPILHPAVRNLTLQSLLHPLKDNIWILSTIYHLSWPQPY